MSTWGIDQPDGTGAGSAPDADPPPQVGRRGLVGGLAAGAGLVGAGVVGGLAGRAGAATGFRKLLVTVEVACLGETWTEPIRWANAADDDFRAPFLVEGWIYPEGTIKGDGFIPVEEGSIGRWICTGYGISSAARGEPHVTTRQDFLFGVVGGPQVFPADQISTMGIEGTIDKTLIATRSVVGGTGKYLGALGQQRQQFVAWNTSLITASSDQGFCWRDIFDLRVFD